MRGREPAARAESAPPERIEQEQEWAESLAQRLDRPMSVLGILFLFVVLGQTIADDPGLATVLAVAGWLLWLVFAGEFALRWYVAPSRTRFLRRYWWQLVFLLVPFLRFLRLVRLFRVLRATRVLSSAVRGSRSAGRLLTSRVGWLLAVTTVLVLACGQLLIVTGDYVHYATALHDVALATVVGQPLPGAQGWIRLLNVALAGYSVVIFAALAASIGAYLLRPESAGEAAPVAAPPGRARK